MKPVPLDYVVPSSVEEAVAVLHEGGGEARPIAGGQSLIPLLNLRLATPATLVDVARLPELAGVTVGGSSIVLGAAVTHSDVEHSKELARSLPLLPFVAGHIGHPPIRVRGTLGGSLAHGDPAAEWPTVMALLDATVLAQGVTGSRRISARHFCSSFLTTVLEPDEVLVSIEIAQPSHRCRFAFSEFARQAGAFALVIVAAMAVIHDGVVDDVALGVGGCGSTPLVFTGDALPLAGERLDDTAIDETARVVSSSVEPPSDIHASGEDRREIARALVARTLRGFGGPPPNGGWAP